ncbi:type II toxin-antitoxin system Phd/YefM family antitoxin [Aggregatilinea lenta]|uniref:type II toxin-antitoxin system Phd/YefM family antitoxin n=1 Tax=Aggregatilinea lenta TaxID=913108 RepID=UPI000E5C352E|nr:type II toxin-antitoxin system Phd/YefM family antitoxin [Aggregatilinea lenta]
MNQSPHQPDTTPEVISSTQLQRNIGETMRRVFKDKQHLIVERDGLPVLVMLPVADYEALRRSTEKPTQ